MEETGSIYMLAGGSEKGMTFECQDDGVTFEEFAGEGSGLHLVEEAAPRLYLNILSNPNMPSDEDEALAFFQNF